MLTPLPCTGSTMKSATSSERSWASSAERACQGTFSKPGSSGPKRDVNSEAEVAESAPSVSPWKPCSSERTRGRPVAARPSLIAASTDSAPELVNRTRSTLRGARRSSSSASSAGSASTPSCTDPGRSSSRASISAWRTPALLRPTLNIPKPPSRSRYWLSWSSQRYWPCARAQRRSKPIVRRRRTNCGLIVCAWRSSASAPRSSTSSVSQPMKELCGDVDAAAAIAEAAALTPCAHGQDLGEDRDRGLGRRVGPEVEAGRPGDPIEALLRDACLEQPLAALRLRLARADRAHIERFARERGRQRRDVEPLLVGEDDHGRVGVELEPLHALVGPRDDPLARARQALLGRECLPRVDRNCAPAQRPGQAAERLRGVGRADDNQPRRGAEHFREDLLALQLHDTARTNLDLRELRLAGAIALEPREQDAVAVGGKLGERLDEHVDLAAAREADLPRLVVADPVGEEPSLA